MLPEPVFTLEDLGRLFTRKKKAVYRAICIGAIAGFAFVFCSSPTYKIKATFKEKTDTQGTQNSIQELVLRGLSGSSQSETMSLMKSYQVLRAVVASQGLQAEVKRNWSRLRDHLYAELQWKLPETDWFLFEQVHYAGEEKALLHLRFIDRNSFYVLSKRKIVALGEVGKPISHEDISFVITKIPKNISLRKTYTVHISPWISKADELRKKLTVVPQKTSKSIYELTLLFKDRKQGVRLLDQIMEEYRSFLKRDHDQMAAEQIAYLEQKQGQLYEKLAKTFDEQASILSEAIGNEGFVSLEQEIKNYSELHTKVSSIDLELKRLSSAFAENDELSKKIREFEEERNLLQVALKASPNLTCSNNWMSKSASSEFDLESSRALYAQYAKKFDASQELIASLSRTIDPDSTLLKDPLSQEILANTTSLIKKLQDEKYSSQKERRRWSEELELQKIALNKHIEELVKAEMVNAGNLREKMNELQQSSLTCIDQQLAVLKEHSKSEIEKKADSLLEEKKRLQKKMQEFKNLPERWKLEHWLQIKTDLGKEMMTILTELVESKTIGHQLFHIESKPLDAPIASRFLGNTHLLLLTAISAFGSGLAYFSAALLVAILKGLPLTASALKAMGLPFSGDMNQPETFRHLSFFLGSEKIISLLGGSGPNYSHSLAEQLATGGKKVLLMDCSFHVHYREKDLPGLKQWVDEMPVRSCSNYFFVTSGGFTPFSLEILQSKRLAAFLEMSKNFYDVILLWHSGNLHSVDASALLKISEKAVATITQEQREQLTPLLHWAYHDGNCRITFISTPHEG